MDGPVGKGALQDLTRNKPSLEGLASQDGTSWGKQACEPSCTNTASPGRNHGKLPPLPAPIGRSPSGFCTVHRWAYQAPSSGGTGLQRVCTACPAGIVCRSRLLKPRASFSHSVRLSLIFIPSFLPFSGQKVLFCNA